MQRARRFAWTLVVLTGAILIGLIVTGARAPEPADFLFWVALLVGSELLPVSLGFGTLVTMAFPIHLAIEILFSPLEAMLIVGVGAFDMREIRREIPIWHALFNRAQLMLAAGAASAVVTSLGRGTPKPFVFPLGLLVISAAAMVHVTVNLGLVTVWVTRLRGATFGVALRNLLPKPVGGFAVSQVLLAALGAATAAAYREIGPFVAAFLIPLLFARLSIQGARAQQELSERIQKQQQALLEATEKVFSEREHERKRIAEQIHDSSLQLLAAATYGTSNAQALMRAGRTEEADQTIASTHDAIDQAIASLRGSLTDLRKSSVEEGGLMETIRKFADQASTLWDVDVAIDGDIKSEPPLPVALAAFQILQEGLTNALKHARGSAITVRISEEDGMVHIVVEDEGPGFDPESEVGADHVGMQLMKERAARVGGRIQLDSRPGAGTRLEAVLPGGVTQ